MALKNIGTLTIFLAFLVLSLSPSFSISQTPSLKASLVKYDPYPAEPGKFLRVWISISNSGLEKANNVLVEVKPEYPFSLSPNENATKIISIDAYDSAIIDYKLIVSPNAISGENELKVRYSLDNGKSWVEEKLEIVVQTKNAIISLEKVEVPKLEAGKRGYINITLRNLGDAILRFISVNIAFSSLPISPLSSSEREIYQILPEKEKTLTFPIIAKYDAECGIYLIPINLSYYDDLGNSYSKSYYSTLQIVEEPKIRIALSQKQLNSGENEVEVKVINEGLSKVKGVKVFASSPYLISENPYYIGELEGDDYEIATFKFKINELNLKKTKVEFKVEYYDCTNSKREFNESVEFQVVYEKESYLGLFSVLVIAVLVGVYAVFHKKKKRKR